MLTEGIVIQAIHIVSDFEMRYVIFSSLKAVAGGSLRITVKLLLSCQCFW